MCVCVCVCVILPFLLWDKLDTSERLTVFDASKCTDFMENIYFYEKCGASHKNVSQQIFFECPP